MKVPSVDFVIPTLGHGGAQKALAEVASTMARDGWRVRILVFTHADAPVVPRLSDEVRVRGLGSHLGRRLSARSLPRVAGALRRELADVRPDVVLAFQDVANLVCCAIVPTLQHRPRLVVCERRDPRTYRHAATRAFARRALYGRADRLVVQTAAIAARMRTEFAGPISVIPNACHLPASPARPGVPAGGWTLLAAGRLERWKGFALLVEAAEIALATRPDWTLVVHGTGPQETELRELVARSAAGARVRLAGHTQALQAAMSDAHLFAFPSRFEGFPNVLAEAVGAGLPAVAYCATSGVAELVEPDANGLLLGESERTPAALAAALGTLMDDPARRRAWGEHSRRVAARYAPERVAGMWREIIVRPEPAASG